MSSESDERNRLIKETTNDLLRDKFIQEIGQKATVERSSIQNERMDLLRAVLADIGRDLQTVGAVPKGMTYAGSFSVHVFTSEILRQAAFATVSNKGSCDGALADAAMRELNGSTMESYGKQRQKLRSGF